MEMKFNTVLSFLLCALCLFSVWCTNQEKRYPGTRPARSTEPCPEPSYRWRWGRRIRLPPEDLSGCYPTANPSLAPHSGTNILCQSQMLPVTADSAWKGKNIFVSQTFKTLECKVAYRLVYIWGNTRGGFEPLTYLVASRKKMQALWQVYPTKH